MIVVKLIGGLGNQMFQYALGRRLAHERRVPLKVDLSWFRAQKQTQVDTVRSYALDGWRIRASPATARDLWWFPQLRPGLTRFSDYIAWLAPPVVSEKSCGFDPDVLRTPRSAYLSGYWQSERYFGSVRSFLLEDFALSIPPCSHASELARQIEGAPVISLHVRRADYLSNPAAAAFHGVCSPEYYRSAMRWVAGQVGDAHFLVFGDDLQWARDKLQSAWPTTFVEHSLDCPPHNDIWLMSLCSHHIIANSSFSWWGAWLAENPSQLVVAPRRWFRDERLDTSDLLPDRWTML